MKHFILCSTALHAIELSQKKYLKVDSWQLVDCSGKYWTISKISISVYQAFIKAEQLTKSVKNITLPKNIANSYFLRYDFKDGQRGVKEKSN